MDFLSITDVANELKITRQAVFKHIKKGTLAATKHGNLWKITNEDFQKFKHRKRNRK